MQPSPIESGIIKARHGFFTRQGGVSTGPYASLNASLSGGDDVAAVTENRRRVADVLGAIHLMGVTQVHGTAVVTVSEPWQQGAGPRADALVTSVPGLALGVITADCAPVLFHDSVAGVIGAAHAGWRGAAAGVLEATIAAMIALGADPSRMAAAVGPCIAQASYEVGPDLRDAIRPTIVDGERFFAPGRREERWQFDLAGYCAGRLAAAGVAHVNRLGLDTMVDAERFFSHRRRTLAGGGPIGHQISAIVA